MIQPPDHLEVFKTGEVFIHRGILTTNTNHAPNTFWVLQDINTINVGTARIRPNQRGQHLHRGGLTRTVRSQKCLNGSLGNTQG